MVEKNSVNSDKPPQEEGGMGPHFDNGIPRDNDYKKDYKTVGLDEKIVAVIPACGWGGQMFPLTGGMPKTLLPVRDAPLLVQILRSLDQRYFSKALILCNKWYGMIQSYVDAFVALDALYDKEVRPNDPERNHKISVKVECREVDESESRAAALRDLYGKGELTDPFLLHYADVLIHRLPTRENAWRRILLDYNEHRKSDVLALLLISKVFKYPVGVITMDHDHVITEYVEKPEAMLTEYANCAVALFSRSFVANNHVEEGHEDVFKDSLVPFIKEGRKAAAYVMGPWTHLQQPRDWREEQKKHHPHLSKWRL